MKSVDYAQAQQHMDEIVDDVQRQPIVIRRQGEEIAILLSLEYDHIYGHTLDMPLMERVTVTLPADLVEKIDQVGRNRSRFIVEAVEHELAQRRREALLQSVQNPHPETTDLVYIGLSDWVSDRPSDEMLVDATAGTPVRWVEGQGWIKESA